MSLVVLEHTLLELYSYPQKLRVFLADSHEYTASLGLSPQEKKALCDLPYVQLAAFQKQLHRKSLRVARQGLRGQRRVALMSLHPQGPALLWGNPESPSVAQLSEANYHVLHRLARLKQPISLRAILTHHFESSFAVRDLFTLSNLVIRHRLQGKYVTIPLVL